VASFASFTAAVTATAEQARATIAKHETRRLFMTTVSGGGTNEPPTGMD
jgi:hypothetical protein